jgi:chromosome segregation ATPase
MSFDRSTLESQIRQLASNHTDLLGHLQQRTQQITSLQQQLEGVQREVEQYKGALQYSQHIQEQTKKTLEQAIAAQKAAELSAASAAIAVNG